MSKEYYHSKSQFIIKTRPSDRGDPLVAMHRLWLWLLALLGSLQGQPCLEGRYNYASFDCAARILATNPGAKSSSSILHDQKDSYLRNLCSYPDKWVVIELCQDIRIDSIVLANHEFFSSTFREVEVWLSKRYPPPSQDEWRLLGRWTAENRRGEQVFAVPRTDSDIYARFLRVRILSSYGNEYYCPLSVIKVFGRTMLDDYADEEETKKRKKLQQEVQAGILVVDEDVPAPSPPTKTAMPKKAFSTCPLRTPVYFNITCASPAFPSVTNTVHALQPFQARALQRIVPLVNRVRPVFPLPLKPVRKRVILQLACNYRNELQWPQCSSQWRASVVLQRAYMDPDRLIISDIRGYSGIDPEDSDSDKGTRRHHENIFKSLSDRLDALERAHTKHALLLQAAIQRFDMQIDQILAEMDMTDLASRGLESYRKRLERYLMEYVEERVDRMEEHIDRTQKKDDEHSGSRRMALLITGANGLVLLIVLLLLMKRSLFSIGPARPTIIVPPMSPLRDQTVPKHADSLERVEQTLMEASPLLLFDPETDLVDGIYSASPQPIVKPEGPLARNPSIASTTDEGSLHSSQDLGKVPSSSH